MQVMVTKQLLGVCAELFNKVCKDAQQVNAVEEEGKKIHSPLAEKGSKKSIDREALEKGCLDEVSFVFSHIVMSTMYPVEARAKRAAV